MQGVLVFLAAGCRLAVAVGDVLRLIVEGPTAPIPFGHRALAGVMRTSDDDDTVLFGAVAMTSTHSNSCTPATMSERAPRSRLSSTRSSIHGRCAPLASVSR